MHSEYRKVTLSTCALRKRMHRREHATRRWLDGEANLQGHLFGQFDAATEYLLGVASG